MNMDLHLVDFYGIKMKVTKTMFHGSVMGLKSSNFQTLAISNSRIWTALQGEMPRSDPPFLNTPGSKRAFLKQVVSLDTPADIPRILRGVSPFFSDPLQGFHQWLSMGGSRSVASVEFWGLPRRCKTTNFPHNARGLGVSHTIHVWYIYLHEWLISMVDVGTIYHSHGSYGVCK